MSQHNLTSSTEALAARTGDDVERFLLSYCESTFHDCEQVAVQCKACVPDIGIRIRPLLLRVSSEIGGLRWRDCIDVAAGIEMIQISTLVVDDALDGSDLRNGQASVAAGISWQASVAIGNALASQGLNLVSKGLAKIKGADTEALTYLLQVHADVYSGQFLDLRYEGNTEITEHQYLDMISRTTARFIQAPLVIGAIISNAPESAVKILAQFGHSLGLAYQIRDDIIDIVGDVDLTGKPAAGDVRRCKMRLPTIHALRALPSARSTRLATLLMQGPLSDQLVTEAVALIWESSSIQYCVSKVKEHCCKAVDRINTLPDTFDSGKKHFATIAGWVSNFEPVEQH